MVNQRKERERIRKKLNQGKYAKATQDMRMFRKESFFYNKQAVNIRFERDLLATKFRAVSKVGIFLSTMLLLNLAPGVLREEGLKLQIYKLPWSSKQVYEGCMIASLAHAIMVAKDPEFSYEHSWDGFNYSVQDGMGSRGTITFCDQACIGAFRVETMGNKPLDYRIVLDQLSTNGRELAYKETLQYLLDQVDGKVSPVVTTMFWTSESGYLVTPHDFDQFRERGGHLLEKQTLEPLEAIRAWKDYHEMSDDEVKLLETLVHKKLSYPERQVVLSPDEVLILGDDEEGLSESRISFGEIGIQL